MAVIQGTINGETLTGGSAVDYIYGYAGDDTLLGGGGNDWLVGGTGNDTMTGGAGNDIFFYDSRGFGSDTITDFATGDKIDLRGINVGDLESIKPYVMQVGDDVVLSTVYGGSLERITILNATLANVLASIRLNPDTDPLTISGTISDDVLFGGRGQDRIYAGSGDDEVNAGVGNDYIYGENGDDLLRGGTGNDFFGYGSRGFGADTIADFTTGDRLDLRGMNVGDLGSIRPYIIQSGNDVVMTTYFGGNLERVIIQNATLANVLAQIKLNADTDPLTVSGTINTDHLFGGRGQDRLYGDGGNDQLNAGVGNDYLHGGNGNDLLRGGTGNDLFVYDERGFGADTISDFATGDKIDLRGIHVGDIQSITPYIVQSGDDVVISTYWGGNLERITIQDATLDAVKAAIKVNPDTDPLTLSGTINTDYLFGGRGQDRLFGDGGNDHINAGVGNDYLYGGNGDDQLRGGAGNDLFVYNQRGFGTDTIVDFASGDRLDLRGVHVGDIGSIKPYIAQSGSDVVISTYYAGNLERIIVKNSTISAVQNALLYDASTDPQTTSGTISADYLFGGRGQDRLFGENGNDHINAGFGNDYLDGGSGNDLLRGGGGSDVFVYGERGFGADVIADFTSGDKIDLRGIHVGDIGSIDPYIVQDGNDVVISTYYGGSLERITVQNSTISAVRAGLLFDADSDPNTISGTISTDTLFGGRGQDRLFGEGGNDRLIGGFGDDYLTGGSGADQLFGGAGADRFVFDAGDSPTSGTLDRVMDFSRAEGDKIDLRPIDSNPGAPGDQPLSYVGGAFSAAYQVRITALSGNNFLVEVNLDTDADPEMAIHVVGSALNSSDLLL
jgi:Ca2+-binding RTX toxin-like protein